MTKSLTLSNAGNETGTSSGIITPIPDTPPVPVETTKAGFSPLLGAVLAGAATYAIKKEASWGAGAFVIAFAGISLYNSKTDASTVTKTQA